MQLSPCPIPTLDELTVWWNGFKLGSGKISEKKESPGLCQLMPHLWTAAVASFRLNEVWGLDMDDPAVLENVFISLLGKTEGSEGVLWLGERAWPTAHPVGCIPPSPL